MNKESTPEKEKDSKENGKDKGLDISHKNLEPQLPQPVINPPKEATDPAEIIKRA